jgi:hypothetical protein
MSNPASNSSVVFHVKGYRSATVFLFVLVVEGIVALIYLLPWVFRDSSFVWFYLLFIAVLIFSIAKVYRNLRLTRLVLSPQGIEYYAVNFQLTSAWEDLNLSKERSIMALFWSVRLITKKPIVTRNLSFDWNLDVWLGNARYFIPLSPRIWDRYNELVELIKLHRPDLLQGQKL